MNRYAMLRISLCLAVSAGLTVLLWACQSEYQDTLAPAAPMAENLHFARGDAGGTIADIDVAGEAAAPVAGAVDVKSSEAAATERYVIKNARFAIKVDDFSAALGKIRTFTEEKGGFVFRASQAREQNEDLSGTIVLKLPQQHYNDMMQFLNGLGKGYELTEEAEDVSDNIMDIDVRLNNSRALEKRILAILEQQAGKITEVLEAERELARVREKIESLEGQKAGLMNRVRYSTFTVNLFAGTSKSVEIRTWYGPLLQDLRDLGRMLASSLGTLLKVIVGIVPWLLALWFVSRWWRRRKQKRALRNTIINKE